MAGEKDFSKSDFVEEEINDGFDPFSVDGESPEDTEVEALADTTETDPTDAEEDQDADISETGLDVNANSEELAEKVIDRLHVISDEALQDHGGKLLPVITIEETPLVDDVSITNSEME